jgi:hypothetical protein
MLAEEREAGGRARMRRDFLRVVRAKEKTRTPVPALSQIGKQVDEEPRVEKGGSDRPGQLVSGGSSSRPWIMNAIRACQLSKHR